ncbi:MAG: tRNA adenosine deaminase-associated protein [Propionibacteriales bacterium]|nr:tRNA adenosine deaminase-associated protein [Propionibacteriales bacterium]
MNASEDDEFEMPNRGDDRPGLDDLDDELDEVDVEDVDDEEDDDYPEDATEDDIDLVIALYREDGQPVALPLDLDLANDLDGLITQLRRIPGDAGAVGFVSVADEVFVIVRVRGKHVQVFCSDALAADEWPIAHDVVEFLDDEVVDDSDEGYPVGDSDILADAGLPDFELEAMAEDYDQDSTALLELIAKKIGFAAVYTKAVASFE